MITPLRPLLVILTLGLNLHVAGAAEPEKKAGAAEITTFEQALVGIPREVMADLRPGSRGMTEAVFKAKEQASKNVKDKSGLFKITVQSVEKFKSGNDESTRYRIHAKSEKIRESGVPFNAHVTVVTDAGENEKAAKLQRGDRITVSGKVANAIVYGTKYPGLDIIMVDAKLE